MCPLAKRKVQSGVHLTGAVYASRTYGCEYVLDQRVTVGVETCTKTAQNVSNIEQILQITYFKQAFFKQCQQLRPQVIMFVL